MIKDKLLKLFSAQFPEADVSIDDICFNITLGGGDLFSFCFYVDEDDDTISVVSTDEEGFERGKIVNKEYIESFSLLYSDDLMLEEPKEQRMFN